MKINLAKLKVLAPLYMTANPERKKELLQEYNITKVTFYAALKRYGLALAPLKTTHMVNRLEKLLVELDSGLDIEELKQALDFASLNSSNRSAKETFKIFCEKYAELTNDSVIQLEDISAYIKFNWREISNQMICAADHHQVEQIMFEHLVRSAVLHLSFSCCIEYNCESFMNRFANDEHKEMIEKFQNRYPSLAA
ncbi:hypothetical protein UXN78_23280 [Enterobacter hormaechei]